MDEHYLALIIAYVAAAGLWFGGRRLFFRSFFAVYVNFEFKKPWLEFVYGIIAVVAILGIGQLYLAELLIPNNGNNYIDALNQFLIFSPTLALLFVRKQPIETIWLPRSKILLRMALGFAIAICSLGVYWLFRKNAVGFGSILTNTYHPQNISHLVQVFMEDITIALLFVRLSSWIGNNWSIGIIAFLFAAGHIPSMLAIGVATNELLSLFLDTFIGIIILTALSKSRDVWWFFMLHFAMDMTQFYGG